MPTTPKTITKTDIKRAKSLLARIHRLQSDLYYFEDHLKDKGVAAHDLVGQAGFELDASYNNMEDALQKLQILY